MNEPVCRICKTGPEKQKVRAPIVYGGRKEHKFFECENCDAIYLLPPLTEAEEAKFYKLEFEKFMSSRAGDEQDWTNAQKHIDTNQDNVKRRWEFMKQHVTPGMDLLEIGCSTGFMLDHFRHIGINAEGIELSDEFVPFLRQRGYPIYLSLDELLAKKPESAFDVITHFFVFEHIRDPFSFLSKTFDLLKKGGCMIMEVPCANDPLTSLYDIPAFEKFYWSIAHHYYYRPKTIDYIFNKLGFDYEIAPEQRYDLSNHMHWMTHGKPGGQGNFNHFFSDDLLYHYRKDLIESGLFDTMFIYVKKKS